MVLFCFLNFLWVNFFLNYMVFIIKNIFKILISDYIIKFFFNFIVSKELESIWFVKEFLNLVIRVIYFFIFGKYI